MLGGKMPGGAAWRLPQWSTIGGMFALTAPTLRSISLYVRLSIHGSIHRSKSLSAICPSILPLLLSYEAHVIMLTLSYPVHIKRSRLE